MSSHLESIGVSGRHAAQLRALSSSQRHASIYGFVTPTALGA